MGKKLTIFVMGDDSNSLKTVDVGNWDGRAFIGNRQQLVEVRKQGELSQPAIYLLLSNKNDEGDSLTDFYVGETDNFVERMAQHVQTKDWWQTFVVFVSMKNQLTKAHVRFLERELHLLAQKSITSLRIKNDKISGGSPLPKSDVSDMEEFLKNVRFVLETLGLSYFPSQSVKVNESISKDSEGSKNFSNLEDVFFTITIPKDLGLNNGQPYVGKLQVLNGNYVLKVGSFIRREAQESFERHSYFELWNQVVNSDSVKPSDNEKLLVTIKDIEFRSPSAAGAIVRGRATNGRTEWKRESDGRSLVECENDLIKE